ncbi:amidohydrolase family protein [Limobrevibacterium gyesilva]|uniref:Amidohydrolase family protein n=1 Tax=Limobrevibacterium gyesilva TaxID=2991712 RepID=A0AA41YLK7_9PROT|nr:amidohydrolase family protein [Limobrevibacterium gyesilva]MCW3476076.1 amidohydrolase family protein [Limobrevibacterium gyesilva]
MTQTILIDRALVLAAEGFRPGAVLIDGPTIAAVAFTDDEAAQLRSRAAQHVRGAGCWLIPGLIDAHAHGYATLLRGTENSLPLELWALYTTLYGRGYDDSAIRAAILLGAAERIRAGITGVIDHTPMVHLGRTALDAHERSGLRVGYAAFLQDVSDYDLLDIKLPPALMHRLGGPPPLDADAYADRFSELVQTARAGSGRVAVQLGPNAPQRCSPEAWDLWRELRDRHGVPVHMHLMETRAQALIGQRKWRGGLIREIERQGLLEGDVAAAHGIWLTADERDRLARHGATIVHNPASNLMLGSGVMPLAQWRAAGANIALGTDSANTGGRHDLFEAMRLAMMLPRVATTDHTAWPRASEILAMATRQAAPVLGLTGRLGTIAPGQLADLVLVRHDQPATLPMQHNEAALVQSASPDAVDSVMVNGAWVMRARRILAFDEAAALAEAEAAADAIRTRAAAELPVLDAALPGLAERLRAVLAAYAEGQTR